MVVLIGENAAEFESGDDLSFVEEQARRLAASGSKRPDNDEDDSEDFDREDKVVAADMKIDKVINQDPFDDKDDNQWSLSSSSSSSEEEPASKRRKTTKKKKSVQSTIADTVRYQSDDENSDIGLNKGDFLEQMMRRFKESLSNK